MGGSLTAHRTLVVFTLAGSLAACQGSSSGASDSTSGRDSDVASAGASAGDGPSSISASGGSDATAGCASVCETEGATTLRFDEANAAATHNSYSGSLGNGAVGSIAQQLDSGVRAVELDIHNDDYATEGFRVGHNGPGGETAVGDGNPPTPAMGPWLDVIAAWSDAHPDHSPITLYLDLKDDLDNRSTAAGDLTALDLLVTERLGAARIYRRDALGADPWPTLESMRGMVVVVLTGNESTQLDYIKDQGEHPSIAVDTQGRVIEAHDSGDGELWLWTGQIEGDGRITWHRHARYDTGREPVFALGPDGLVVEVHEDPDFADDTLWYRTGRLGDDFEVTWYSDSGLTFPGEDNGVDPSVAFVSGTTVREIHKSQSDDQRWYWQGSTVNTTTGVIDWSRPEGDGRTDEPFFPRTSIEYDGREYEVVLFDDGPFDSILGYRSEGQTERIRYEQRMFTSVRRTSDERLSADGVRFFAEDARNTGARNWAVEQRMAGGVVRIWAFNDPSQEPAAPVNFPASDVPYDLFYEQYCDAIDCVE